MVLLATSCSEDLREEAARLDHPGAGSRVQGSRFRVESLGMGGFIHMVGPVGDSTDAYSFLVPSSPYSSGLRASLNPKP